MINKNIKGFFLPILVAAAICCQRAPVPIIPMEDFFRNPTKVNFELSPNGEYIAFMQPWERRLNVHVQQIGSDDVVRITSATERDIAGYIWASNDRLVYVQDRGGDENYRLYAVDADGENEMLLTPFDEVQTRLIDDLEDIPEEMLIGLNKRDPRLHDVYRVNVETGDLELLAENPGNISGWITDHEGKLRAAITSDGVMESILYRETEEEEFKTIATTSFKETLAPLFFTFDNRNLYVASNRGRDKDAIYTFDVSTAEEDELIFEHPEVDVTNLIYSRLRKVITGVSYTTDMTEYHFFDEDREALQRRLESLLKGVEVRVVDFSRDEAKCLVGTFSDKTRGSYYFYDRDTDELMKLADISPWLDEKHMASMKPIKYTSRDGLTIHGYLTVPVGMKADNLPVVVNPHGGPWARDVWGFNPTGQFLANRGYAVLLMNFRGSTGYGREFWEASFKQWGKTMQDDISDGVLWLVDEGIADPERIGIYGGSYGGYATLAGVTFTPDLYACGVDYVGPSNLFTLLETIPPYWELMRQMMYEMMGDPENDEELLRAASPLFHADSIKVPLLVAQGANDPRVKQAESDQIVAALETRGIDVPYMVKENEGHGFANEENRFDFYRAMEQFFAQYLGGRLTTTEP
ncbi:S9 family peptidase [Candidatus Neomarinimicrobiota bacterium]